MAKDKKTDTWMPLWIGAYLADTMMLTTLQHGAYFLLLVAYWRERGPLRDDDDALRSITKLDKSEWKKMRPVLATFFKVGDGVWWHKRVEQEIASADSRKTVATNKAKAGAKGRWDKPENDAPSIASSIPQAMLGGMPEGMPEHMLGGMPYGMPNRCPPPTPIPIVAKEVTLSHSTPEAWAVDNSSPAETAAEVCAALKAAGIPSVSPSHPELLALIGKGVTPEMFADVARKSVTKTSPFAYLLSVLSAQLKSAAEIGSGPGVAEVAWDTSRKTIEAMGQRLGLGVWDELSVSPNREHFSGYTERVRRAMLAQQETAGA